MRSAILVIAAAAGLALAQSSTSSCTVPTSTLSAGGMSTVTQTYTSTYCPKCEEVTTTYETVYSAFCPTGLTDATYTCTETCGGSSSCRTGLPPGFTTTVDVCTVCGDTPVTATLTQPCTAGSMATATEMYETVYSTFASSGLAPATYTVTASCAATPCPMAASSGVVPAGFTTTVASQSGTTATLTVPISAATGSTTIAGEATTVSAASGSGSTGTGSAGTGSTGTGSTGTGASSGEGSSDTGSEASSGSESGSASSTGSSSSGPTPESYTGAASSNHAGAYLVAGVAALVAFARF